MKKILFITLLHFFILFPLLGQQQIDVEPVAELKLYKRERIWLNNFKEQIQNYEKSGQTTTVDQRLQLLNDLIDERLILQAAEVADIKVTQMKINQAIQANAALVQQLQGQGMAWEDITDIMQKQLIARKLVEEQKSEYIQGEIQEARKSITEKQIKNQYTKYATLYSNPALRKIKHIFINTEKLEPADKVKARERAEEIYRELRAGKTSFDELAEKYSDDSETRYSGGDIGYILRQQDPRLQIFGESFIEKVFDLEIGKVSKVIESKVGYHIIKVTEERDPRIPALDDPILPGQKRTVREDIEELILMQKQNEIFMKATQDLIQELRNQAEIEIYEDKLDW